MSLKKGDETKKIGKKFLPKKQAYEKTEQKVQIVPSEYWEGGRIPDGEDVSCYWQLDGYE